MKQTSNLAIILISFLLFSIVFPLYTDSEEINDLIKPRDSSFSIQNSLLDLKDSLNQGEIYNENSWNAVENSTIERSFHNNNSINETSNLVSIDNCDDWSLDSNFNFTNIREEKITNGDAETTETLWTDYIPSHYDGNVTRESNPPSGEVINGNNSWYFDIISDDHTTIVGFDDPINVSSNSVVFSFSYSLLRNNLDTSYDSNICIRLFFQFDIYIFIWFDGNLGVLSNVTGPGGYADLLVNEATFDGAIHEYMLNVTALGLELFNQEPDQLRSLAIQTWGEIQFDMEFIMDDISLTDQVSPLSVGMQINSIPVIGTEGFGFIQLSDNPAPQVDYLIQFTTQDTILWDCSYTIIGSGKSNSQRLLGFRTWDEVLWRETINDTILLPLGLNNITITKWIPTDWIIDQVLVNELSQSYSISETNSTHKNVQFYSSSISEIEYRLISTNLMDNIILSDYQITHDDSFSIYVESRIYSELIDLYILSPQEDIVFFTSNISESNGNIVYSDIKLSSDLSRGNYTIIAIWESSDEAGISTIEIELTSISTNTMPTESNITINYQQNFIIEIDYINLEDNSSIDQAQVSYSWDLGSGILLQKPNKKYSTEIIDCDADPNVYTLNIICSKNGYATSMLEINITVVFRDFALLIISPEIVIPGEVVTINAFVEDNLSSPVPNLEVQVEINDELYIKTWTNDSGYALAVYYISPIYSFSTLNISCSIIFDDIEYLSSEKNISINLFEAPRAVNLGSPNHLTSIRDNESVYFSFQINYPSIGKSWYIDIPVGFKPISALVVSNENNISATISPFGVITWTKEIINSSIDYDILLIEIEKPHPVYSFKPLNSELIIEITIDVNQVPYNGLEIVIHRDSDWSIYDNWNLYLNNAIVTEECNLVIEDELFTFKVYSTSEIDSITYQLKGTNQGIVQIEPSTIILGIGIAILTVTSTILLFKKKSDVSLDVQL
ncbi:MAG: hypothetical protein HZR80_01985 [Candidatus Heimdallarchaeota archaeon]